MKTLRIVILVGLLGLFSPLQAGAVPAGVNVWTGIGPGGGDVLSLAIDPLTPSTLYAGTYGGVYQSTDGGGSWRAYNTGLSVRWVTSLAFDPSTPANLYAGTYGGGVFVVQPVNGMLSIYLPLSVYAGD
jgi:hypothetical protein